MSERDRAGSCLILGLSSTGPPFRPPLVSLHGPNDMPNAPVLKRSRAFCDAFTAFDCPITAATPTSRRWIPSRYCRFARNTDAARMTGETSDDGTRPFSFDASSLCFYPVPRVRSDSICSAFSLSIGMLRSSSCRPTRLPFPSLRIMSHMLSYLRFLAPFRYASLLSKPSAHTRLPVISLLCTALTHAALICALHFRAPALYLHITQW